MKNVMWRGKRSLRKWEADKQTEGHHQRLRSIRPVSCDFEWEPPTLNQNKKLMLQEDKFTEIERENRYLLEKIATTMRKKSQWEGEGRMNRTLNNSFRRKQLESIEAENARLLKRLQGKKSDYDAKKLKEEWKKQKEVIKNIAFYPFVIRSHPRHRRRLTSKQEHADNQRMSPHSKDVEMVRARTFEDEGFVVTILLNSERLRIVGQRRKTREQKIIDIPRRQALAFVEQQCEGQLQKLFDRLSFDQQENVLYLIGSGGDMALATIREKRPQQQEEQWGKDELAKAKETSAKA